MATEIQTEANAWDRWPRLFIAAAVFFQALSLFLFFDEGPHDVLTVGLAVGLSLVFLGWYVWLMLNLDRRVGRPLWQSLGVIGIGVALWIALIPISPSFFTMAGALYPAALFNIPFRPAIGVGVLFILIIWLGNLLWNGPPYTLFPSLYLVIAFAPALFLAFFINAIITQSNSRRELIDELQATRDELAKAERQAGVLTERQRLAGEIHDTLAQGFTSIVMQMEAAEAAIGDDDDHLRRHIDQARDTARQSLEQARRLVAALRPDLLERAPLHEALARLVENWSQETGITVHPVSTGEPCRLHPDVEVTLFRAVQEALNNIRKHADASEVTVTLSYLGDAVIVDVQDDGKGFDVGSLPAPDESGGFGLPALRERVSQLRGDFTLESTPGEGTTLALSLPVYDGDGQPNFKETEPTH